MLIGVWSEYKFFIDYIFIFYRIGKDKKGSCNFFCVDSIICFFLVEEKVVEYYFVFDVSVVIEYINCVIFLEDDDVVVVVDGCFFIY